MSWPFLLYICRFQGRLISADFGLCFLGGIHVFAKRSLTGLAAFCVRNGLLGLFVVDSQLCDHWKLAANEKHGIF